MMKLQEWCIMANILKKTNESVGNNFRFNKDYYELYVPDNTVTDSWNIDMNG